MLMVLEKEAALICQISRQKLQFMYFTSFLFLHLSPSLEMLDKVEPPSIPEGYAMSVAFSALLDLVRGITTMIERELAAEEEAAAEFREAHPDQEWKPQPGENVQKEKMFFGAFYSHDIPWQEGY